MYLSDLFVLTAVLPTLCHAVPQGKYARDVASGHRLSTGTGTGTGSFQPVSTDATPSWSWKSPPRVSPSSHSNIHLNGTGPSRPAASATGASGSYRVQSTGGILNTAGTGGIFRQQAAPARTTSKPSAPTSGNSPETTDCKIITTMANSADASFGITGIQTYCTCGKSGEVQAGLNLATSGTHTTSYCAMGEPVPTAYSQIPVEGNGQPASTYLAAQASASAAAAKCTNGAFVDSSCFNELDLPDYLMHWWTANQGKCQGTQFAECFYALETKYAPSDCAQLNNDAACTQPVWNDFKSKTNGIQNFYVAWNLWNTNGFFLDMYTAIGNAEGSSQAGLAAIIKLLDPPQQQNIALGYVLDALSFGLSLYSEGSILVKALIRSAPQTSSLLGKLYPSGTVDGEYQDWADVSNDLGKVTDSFRASVAQGLPLIQNNVTAFISWSQGSGLSGDRPSLNGLTDSMTQALNTYAIAQVINSQGIVVSRAPDTDVHALQTNGSQLNWDTGCSGGYTNGICDTFFWDGTDTYGLTDAEHMTKNFHDELTSFFAPGDNNAPSLTTGELLFSGAQKCYAATGNNGGANPGLDPSDPSQIQCLSNLRICTWAEDGFGPFDNSCKNLPDSNAVLPGFGVSGCIGETGDTSSIDVPHAYLGPGIYQDGHGVADIQTDSFCDNIDEKKRKVKRDMGAGGRKVQIRPYKF